MPSTDATPLLRRLRDTLIVDAPLTLAFVFVCVGVHVVSSLPLLGSFSTTYFGVHPVASIPALLQPLSLWRLVSHPFGHSSWSHLHGNCVNLMLVGPAVEAEHGARRLVLIFLWVAITSGLAHIFWGPPNAVQLGASGVVFCIILLASLRRASAGKVPVSFVVTLFLWVGNELASMSIGGKAGVSHLAHLTGALVGSVMGYRFSAADARATAASVAADWLARTRAPKD